MDESRIATQIAEVTARAIAQSQARQQQTGPDKEPQTLDDRIVDLKIGEAAEKDGWTRPREQATKTPDSLTPERIDDVLKYIANLLHQAAFERSQLEQEIDEWRKQCDALMTAEIVRRTRKPTFRF